MPLHRHGEFASGASMPSIVPSLAQAAGSSWRHGPLCSGRTGGKILCAPAGADPGRSGAAQPGRGSGPARTSLIVVRMASAVINTALPTHHWQIALMEKSSR